jgi:hypothetical protein
MVRSRNNDEFLVRVNRDRLLFVECDQLYT